MKNIVRDLAITLAIVLTMAVLGSLTGCKETCSPGVQKEQTNPLDGDRPGVCKEKK